MTEERYAEMKSDVMEERRAADEAAKRRAEQVFFLWISRPVLCVFPLLTNVPCD